MLFVWQSFLLRCNSLIQQPLHSPLDFSPPCHSYLCAPILLLCSYTLLPMCLISLPLTSQLPHSFLFQNVAANESQLSASHLPSLTLPHPSMTPCDTLQTSANLTPPPPSIKSHFPASQLLEPHTSSSHPYTHNTPTPTQAAATETTAATATAAAPLQLLPTPPVMAPVTVPVTAPFTMMMVAQAALPCCRSPQVIAPFMFSKQVCGQERGEFNIKWGWE